MTRKIALAAVVVVVLAAAVVVPAMLRDQKADAAKDWLKDFDAVAKEFKACLIVTERAEGQEPTETVVDLEGPRRMIYYTPETSKYNGVFAGAVYAFHINGNPEVIMAIENSGTDEEPDTFIEISRLSGGAVRVYRGEELVADFPARMRVDGAYVGLTR